MSVDRRIKKAAVHIDRVCRSVLITKLEADVAATGLHFQILDTSAGYKKILRHKNKTIS